MPVFTPIRLTFPLAFGLGVLLTNLRGTTKRQRKSTDEHEVSSWDKFVGSITFEFVCLFLGWVAHGWMVHG